MKTYLLLLTSGMLCWFISPATAQTEQAFTLATNIEMENVDKLIFHPEGKLEVDFWNQSYVQVEIEVSAPGFRRSQLKSLVSMGIFRLETDIVGQVAKMEMPRLNRPVVIGGKTFQPNLKIHLSLPVHMSLEQVKMSQDTVAGNM